MDFSRLKTELKELNQNDMLRILRTVESAQGPIVSMAGRQLVLFCSNNYLNMAGEPRIIEAVQKAAQNFGYGAAASRLISGTMSPHIELENQLARWYGKEAALVFPSGFMTNEAVMRTLPDKGDIVLLDKLDHASIVDGAMSGEAEFRTYRRGDMYRLEKFLQDTAYKNKFIVTESIFSMDGDAADIKKLVELKEKYNACLIVDEAHAVGCLGKNGTGLCEQMGLLDKIDIIIGTMSKAIGCSGGFVVAPQVVVDYLINRARAFIYTTAPSPVNCAAAIAAIEIIKNEPDRRRRLADNAEYLRRKLGQAGFDIGGSCSHIVPVILGSPQRAVEMSRRLFECGYFVSAIRPPTVPPGTSRLRISVQSDHTKEQIDGLISAAV